MAKVRLASPFSEISGRTGSSLNVPGLSCLSLGNRPIARKPTISTSQSSNLQRDVKDALRACAASWHLLTPTQLSDWKTWAANNYLFDLYGQAYRPGAYQAFCSINTWRFHALGSCNAAIPTRPLPTWDIYPTLEWAPALGCLTSGAWMTSGWAYFQLSNPISSTLAGTPRMCFSANQTIANSMLEFVKGGDEFRASTPRYPWLPGMTVAFRVIPFSDDLLPGRPAFFPNVLIEE